MWCNGHAHFPMARDVRYLVDPAYSGLCLRSSVGIPWPLSPLSIAEKRGRPARSGGTLKSSMAAALVVLAEIPTRKCALISRRFSASQQAALAPKGGRYADTVSSSDHRDQAPRRAAARAAGPINGPVPGRPPTNLPPMDLVNAEFGSTILDRHFFTPQGVDIAQPRGAAPRGSPGLRQGRPERPAPERGE